jgi:hypothetical protein
MYPKRRKITLLAWGFDDLLVKLTFLRLGMKRIRVPFGIQLGTKKVAQKKRTRKSFYPGRYDGCHDYLPRIPATRKQRI